MTTPILPAQLYALYRKHRGEPTYETKEDRHRRYVSDSDNPEYRPGVSWRSDPEGAKKEFMYFVENNPEMFLSYRDGEDSVDTFLARYPRYLRPTLRSWAGDYLQSVVDVEFDQDPYTTNRKVPYIAPAWEALTGPETLEDSRDNLFSIGNLNIHGGIATGSPKWDSPEARMYREKRLIYGPETRVENEEWSNLADHFGGKANHHEWAESSKKLDNLMQAYGEEPE